MTQHDTHDGLHERATFWGIIIGLLFGALYAILHIKNRGETTRKNITQFGAGSLEMGIESSLDDAKLKANQRLNDSDST